MKKILLTIFLSLVAFGFVACESFDSDWNPMQWTAEFTIPKDRTINVPAKGASYTIMCTNYNPWLTGLRKQFNGQDLWVGPDSYESNGTEVINRKKLTDDWADVLITDKKVEIVVHPNTIGPRTIVVGLTAGNISDRFIFTQEKQKEEE